MHTNGQSSEPLELSHRQLQVLQCSWDMKDVKETAEALGVSPKWVKNLRAEIYRKLGVRSVEGMLRQGVERGYIGPTAETPDWP